MKNKLNFELLPLYMGCCSFQAKHIFKDYPSGVRYVEFKHGGEDTKNWAGHFGVKMTMSGVFVGQKRKKRAKRVR